MSLPLPQGYVAVHVAQPSATYVHSVRCSERHRSERLLVRLFVLACACVCVCVCCSVLVLQCARVFARLHVAVRKLRARVVLRAVQCICMRNCVNELCTSLLFASNASSNALLVCVFASFFSMCAHNGKQTTARKRALRIASAFCCTALRQESQSEWGSEFSTRCCSLQSC